MNEHYSVIIPFHGNIETLKKVLSSLENTNYTQKEVILVNDGSSHDLTSLVKRFQCRLINIPSRQGPSFARNIGAKSANFKNLFFLDSDITIPHDCFTKINGFLKDNPETVLNCLVSAEAPYSNFSSQYANIFFRYSILKQGYNMLFTSFCIIKAEYFHKTEGFNQQVPGPYADDLILGWKLHNNGCKFALIEGIEVRHYKRMRPLKLILYWFLHAYYMEKYFILYRQKFRSSRAFYKKEGPLSVIAILFLLTLVYLKAYNIYAIMFIFSGVLIVINYRFLKFILEEKGLLFALKSMLMIACQQSIYSIGAIAGIFNSFL